MLKKKYYAMLFVLLGIITCPTIIFAEEKSRISKIFLIEETSNTGLIFNINDILLDIESYQGGLGVKHFVNDKFAYRGSLDFSYADSSDTLIFNLGNSIEYHPIKGRVSPYFGGLVDVGLIRYKTETDADNWTKVTTIPISAGPIFGVEVYVLNFLSLFAEYSMTVSYTTTITQQSVAGTVTEDTDSDFGTEIGIGNNSKIGIVLYFYDIKRKEKNQRKGKKTQIE